MTTAGPSLKNDDRRAGERRQPAVDRDVRRRTSAAVALTIASRWRARGGRPRLPLRSIFEEMVTKSFTEKFAANVADALAYK